MGRSCCVPGCRTNYGNFFDGGTFKLPKDKTSRDKWIKFINRPNFKVNNNTVVCVKHFEPKFVIREDVFPILDGEPIHVPRKIPKLSSSACPTILPKRLANHKTKEERAAEKLERDKHSCSIPSEKKTKRGKKRRRKLNNVKLESKAIKKELIDDFINERTEDSSVNHQIKIKPGQETEHISTDEDKDEEYITDDYETEEKLEETTNFIPFCRLCASRSEDAISVFENEESNCELLEKIHTYLPIKMKADDTLPTTICRDCINKLEICHSLVQGCLDADVVLKTMYSLQNSMQVQNTDKNTIDKHSDASCHTKDLLEEDYDYMNLADIKFEIESNADNLEEQTLSLIADEKSNEENNNAIKNSNTVAFVDTKIVDESAFLTELVNKETDLMNKSRTGKRKRKLKFLVVKKKDGNDGTGEVEIEKLLELAMRANMKSKKQKLKERDKPQQMPSVDNSCIETSKEISGLNNTEQNFGYIHEKIARDHTYTRKIPSYEYFDL